MALVCWAKNLVAEPGDPDFWFLRDAGLDLCRVILVASFERVGAHVPFGRELSSWPVQSAFGIGVAVTGLAGVFSSMMIYRDTRRTFWRMKFTSVKFAGTTVLLGPATILFTMTLQSLFVRRHRHAAGFSPSDCSALRIFDRGR